MDHATMDFQRKFLSENNHRLLFPCILPMMWGYAICHKVSKMLFERIRPDSDFGVLTRRAAEEKNPISLSGVSLNFISFQELEIFESEKSTSRTISATLECGLKYGCKLED